MKIRSRKVKCSDCAFKGGIIKDKCFHPKAEKINRTKIRGKVLITRTVKSRTTLNKNGRCKLFKNKSMWKRIFAGG